MTATIIWLTYEVRCDGCGDRIELKVSTGKELRQALFGHGWRRLPRLPAPTEHRCPECWEKRSRMMRHAARPTLP